MDNIQNKRIFKSIKLMLYEIKLIIINYSTDFQFF